MALLRHKVSDRKTETADQPQARARRSGSTHAGGAWIGIESYGQQLRDGFADIDDAVHDRLGPALVIERIPGERRRLATEKEPRLLGNLGRHRIERDDAALHHACVPSS